MSESHVEPLPGDSQVGPSGNALAVSPGRGKPRRPAERALVWGLIAVLLTLTCIETWSRFSYQRAYDFLGHRLEVGDEHGVEALDAADVQAFLGSRKPTRTEDYVSARKHLGNGATHLEVYTWFTFNPLHRREMFVYYDAFGPARKAQPQVLAIQAVEEEFVPLLSPGEQKFMERMANNRIQQRADLFPGMRGGQDMGGMPGMGPRGGRGGRPRAQPVMQVDEPADNSSGDGRPLDTDSPTPDSPTPDSTDTTGI